jgi:hypothetical protein
MFRGLRSLSARRAPIRVGLLRNIRCFGSFTSPERGCSKIARILIGTTITGLSLALANEVIDRKSREALDLQACIDRGLKKKYRPPHVGLGMGDLLDVPFWLKSKLDGYSVTVSIIHAAPSNTGLVESIRANYAEHAGIIDLTQSAYVNMDALMKAISLLAPDLYRNQSTEEHILRELKTIVSGAWPHPILLMNLPQVGPSTVAFIKKMVEDIGFRAVIVTNNLQVVEEIRHLKGSKEYQVCPWSEEMMAHAEKVQRYLLSPASGISNCFTGPEEVKLVSSAVGFDIDLLRRFVTTFRSTEATHAKTTSSVSQWLELEIFEEHLRWIKAICIWDKKSVLELAQALSFDSHARYLSKKQSIPGFQQLCKAGVIWRHIPNIDGTGPFYAASPLGKLAWEKYSKKALSL